ncbi:type II toxin-antitoxin system Phd/YefM family antitoxin [Candidatus Daviesbacteria bacterium]|nr:type II toxin-antitoxin system Phd/YefM family antitoxin [Candidatus Daviesbacteria bacterium]
MKTLPITEARINLPTLVNNAKRKLNEYIITVKGSPAAILLSIDEYESMQETLEILSDKKLMREIKEAEEDVKAGRVKDWEEVKKELGWDV